MRLAGFVMNAASYSSLQHHHPHHTENIFPCLQHHHPHHMENIFPCLQHHHPHHMENLFPCLQHHPPLHKSRTYFRDFNMAAKINNIKSSHLTPLGQQSYRFPQPVGACLTRLKEEIIHTVHICSTYVEKWDCLRDGVHKTHLQSGVTCRS